MSSRGPGLFSDFGKKASDVLTKDYSTEQKFSLSSESDAGVAIASSLAKKGGFSAGVVAAQYKYKKSTVDVKVDTESSIATSITVTDILPSMKTIATCRFPDYNSGKIGVQYFHEHASFTTAVDLNKSPNVDISATIGTPFIAFGTEASYKVDSRSFTTYNAGVSLTKPNYGASVILADKGDAVKATYFHQWDQEKRGVAVAEIARKFSTNVNILTVGASYAIDPHTLVKAKLNNRGNLDTLVQHELASKSFLILSGSFDTLAMDKQPRFGLALSLKP
ncbi:mitochondrial outer membrane protein porin 2-like [Coffea arabica]|uniref:Voltage-dependent anion-selective channel protein n=1 Tax=Coffea arabica TaxID=13443 RepID=A0A6P6US42_COFAR|nr:mitochondrial outer membrane protein porin 2-like [Coffea arabica]